VRRAWEGLWWLSLSLLGSLSTGSPVGHLYFWEGSTKCRGYAVEALNAEWYGWSNVQSVHCKDKGGWEMVRAVLRVKGNIEKMPMVKHGAPKHEATRVAEELAVC
jgi:hypothetical protein